MKKSILALLLAVTMILAAVVIVAPKAEAATPHEDGKKAHCVCCGNAVNKGDHTCDAEVVWKAMEDKALVFNDGGTHYVYLTKDITLTSPISIGNNTTVSICLNGHKITAPDGERAILVNKGEGTTAALNITDCSAKGTGTITGGGKNVTNPTGLEGGNICANANTVLNIFAGNITNGKAAFAGTGSGAGLGGNIRCNGTLNIYGGVISGGTAPGDGGNIYSKGQLNIYGGTVKGGVSGRYGGNICTASVTAFTIENATIKDGTALNNYGGNIYSGSSADVVFKNATITGGKSVTRGGNIYVNNYNSFTIEGGKIADGVSRIGGGISGCWTSYTGLTGAKPTPDFILKGNINFSNNVGGDLGSNANFKNGALNGGTMFFVVKDLTSTVTVNAERSILITKDVPTAGASKVKAYKDTMEVVADGDGLKIQSKDGKLISVNGTGYASVREALAALNEGDTIKLNESILETIALTKSVTFDFNGFYVDGGVDIAAGKTFSGMDSFTNKYDDSEILATVITGEGEVAPTTKTTGTIRKYLAVKNAETNAYTFHRFYVGVTSATLMPAQKNVGVTAKFAITPTVKDLLKDAKSYGVEFNAMNDFTGTDLGSKKASGALAAGGSANTLRALLSKSGYGLLTEDAATKVFYARAYIELADGTKLYTEVASIDAKAMMRAIDADFSTLTPAQKTAVQDMVNGLEWNLPTKFELTNITKN